MYRRRRPRPLLMLQWLIMALIVLVIFKSLGLPWFFWFIPFIFVCNWGGRGWHGRRRWHYRHRGKHGHHRRRHHDEDDFDDDDSDFV